MAEDSTGSERADAPVTVGGEPVVTLAAAPAAGDREFVGAQILPGCGMMILQLTARLPELGVVDLLASPPLDRARVALERGADSPGRPRGFPANVEFSMGAPILAPFANRIRGTPTSGGREIRTSIETRDVTLPANWSGTREGAERYAMHGLLLGARIRDVSRERGTDGEAVRATYDAGDFGGHWPSRTRLDFDYRLTATRFEIVVSAANIGDELLPIGIGSHPYFRIPSGHRSQARLHVPARQRALVNDYDAVLPTGALEPVAQTAYDFTAAGGRPLGEQYLDDCFTDLLRDASGAVVCEIVDPEAAFGWRITGVSPAIQAVQVYAPPSEAYVALEPQYNLADPFGSEWPTGTNTGMVLLEPGETTEYRVRLEMFRP